MRPEDLLAPTPSGVCCKPGDFFIDPTRPVDKAVITHGHSDHARPGHGSVLATQETLDLMRLRYGEDFAGTTQVARRRAADTRRGDSDVPSCRPCARLGAGRGRMQGSADRRRRRLQGRPRSDLCAVRAGAMRRVHHRGDVRPAGVPPRRSDGEIRKLLHSVALFPERAHLVGAYSLGKAQRVIALIRQAGYDKPIYLHGALEKHHPLLHQPRHRSRRTRPVARREQGRACRRHRALPAVVAAGPVDAALSRAGAVLRLRLDAGARARPPARRGAAAGHFRPRRLGRAYRDHRRDRRGEIWVTHGQEDALVHWSIARGLKARPLAIVGYGDEDESDGVTDGATGEQP